MKYICPKCKQAVRIDWRIPEFKNKKFIESYCGGKKVRIKLVIKQNETQKNTKAFI
jgi:hypothetical protein